MDTVRRSALVIAFLSVSFWNYGAAIVLAEQSETATVTSIVSSGPTDTFVDVSAKGKDPAAFAGKWIRFVTKGNPDGFLTRVKSFNPATGEFVLHDTIPAGLVTANDTYHLTGSNNDLPSGTDAVTVAPGEQKKEVDAGFKIKATATAISVGAGSDNVTNLGAVVAEAQSTVVPFLTQEESSSAQAADENAEEEEENDEEKKPTTSEATATGIDLGTGNNAATNAGTLTATASSRVLEGSIPTQLEDAKDVDVSATATARSIAVSAGDGSDSIASTGAITTGSTGAAAGIGVTVGTPSNSNTENDANASDDDDSKKEGVTVTANVKVKTEASGVVVGAGDDVVTNKALLSTTASSTSAAVEGGIVQVKGRAAVTATSTAEAVATGIDAGEGKNTITNTGAIETTATATATARSIDVSTSPAKPAEVGASAAADSGNDDGKEEEKEDAAKAAVNSSATATARATGIKDADDTESTSDGPKPSLSGGVLSVKGESRETRESGETRVDNSAAITVGATSTTKAAAAGAKTGGEASVDATSTAESTAVAIDLGGGGDALINRSGGTLKATADATANALSLALGIQAGNESTSPPSAAASDENADSKDSAAKSAVAANATATATASGVLADGTDSDRSTLKEGSIGGGAVRLRREEQTANASGDDTLSNAATVDAIATATTKANAIGLTIGGETSADVKSTATATASAIDLGAGRDTLTNAATGELSATATATANALSIAVAAGASGGSPTSPAPPASAAADAEPPGEEKPSEDEKDTIKSAVKAGAIASSTATAVSADRGSANQRNVDSLTFEAGVFEVRREQTTTSAGGDDTVENAAKLSATATATSASKGLAVTLGGEASADVTSRSTAAAAGIDLGAGADRLVNSTSAPVTVAATAAAEAVGLAVGFAPSSDSAPPSSSAAAADEPTKSEDDKDKPSANSTIDASATAHATAAGITADGRERESSLLASLRIGNGTLALVYERTTSTTGGRDDVTNSAVVNSTATASSTAGNVGASFGGEASAKVRSTADARATAIDLGGGDDRLKNASTATLTVKADATAGALAAALGVKTEDSTTPLSTASDEKETGSENETPPTTPKPESTPTKSAVDASVSSRAEATGISADGGEQETSLEARFTIGNGQVRLFGEDLVKTGSGTDDVTNNAAITTTATATSPAVSVGVTVGGDAAGKASSAADATATGISLGGGDDTITNNAGGTVNAITNSTAVAVGIAIGVKPDDSSGNGTPGTAADETPAPEAPKPTPIKSALEASATATSRSVGIAADGLAQTATSLDATLTTSSLNVAIEHTKVQARGNDTVNNDAAITANATANAPAVGVGVTIGGGSAAKVTSKAESEAVGIEAGGGNDKVTNNGTLVSDAKATALGVNVAISTSGEGSDEKTKSAVDGSASAVARAAGLAADSLTGDARIRGSLSIDAAGFKIGFENSVTNVSGDDDVKNTGAVSATSNATSTGIGVAFTVKGRAAANTRSAAEASASAIDLGSGVDRVENSGTLTASSTASTEAVKVAVTSEGNATASDGLWKAGIKSESRASGISAVGQEASTTTLDIAIGINGATAKFVEAKDTTVSAGADDITNRGNVNATATANAKSTNVAVTGEGKAAVVTHAEGMADAAGIRTGGGDDTIRNLDPSTLVDGVITVNATANANSGSVSVSGKGAAVAADALWDGGTKAQAIAAGIDSDNGRLESREITLTTTDGVTVERVNKDIGVSGADTIVNEQTVDVTATANSPGFAVSLQADKGLAATVSSVESEAAARAIRAGGGDDDIVNHGTLDATANTVAETANVAISKSGAAIAMGSVWDGGTKASAAAAGIDADGGPADKTDKLTLKIGDGGVTITKFKSESETGGHDYVDNDGHVTATASAIARSLDIALTAKGLSAALSQSTATALADAIRGGDGNDELHNRGRLLADASASAAAASVSVNTEKGVAVAGNAVWDGGVTAEATATGLNGDGGVRSTTTTTTIEVKQSGGIDTVKTFVAASGDDIISNSSEIEAKASATAPAVSVAIGVTGVGAAVSTSTATANAAAIDGGGGNDVIASSGKLLADATSLAVAINGSVVGKGVAIAANDSWDGGTDAAAHARGIQAGSGSDRVTSDGEIVTTATATAASASGAVAVQGVAAAVSTGTATASAFAIDTADQDDVVANTGKLAATSTSRAGTVNISVTTAGLAAAGDKAWDGGTAADAKTRGISAGDGLDRVTNDGEIEARSDAKTTSIAVSVAVNGVAGSVATSTATAASAAIDGGAGNDVIVNRVGDEPSRTGTLTADAVAFATAATVGVVANGVAVGADSFWEGGTTADAKAAGIGAGTGIDTIENYGTINSSSDAKTASVGLSVAATAGVAGAVVGSTSLSTATAVDASETLQASITNAGRLVVTSDALGVSAGIGFSTSGVAFAGTPVWNGGTRAEAVSKGIAAGRGADAVVNTGVIETGSWANYDSFAGTMTVAGVAGALSKAAAIAWATGIDGAAGADVVENAATGTIDATADAIGVNVAVTISGTGVGASIDGGTTADATARGIDGGAGKDAITNDARITAASSSTTVSAAVSLSGIGVGAAISTSTSTANASAIDGGDAADVVVNRGNLTATSTSSATGVAVTVTGVGVAVAGSADLLGGTAANATATTIAAGAGDDVLTNTADELRAEATATAVTVSVAASGAGFNVATTDSTATARAAAIAGDDGADSITTDGALLSIASAAASGVSVSATGLGVSVAGSILGNATTADAMATGIAGGRHDDSITAVESSSIELTSSAESKDTSVAVALAGFSGAFSNARAVAGVVGIDGGDGDDSVTNHGSVSGEPTSTLKSRALAFSIGGASADASGVAESSAIGLFGGAGDDSLFNSGAITLSPTSNAFALTLAVTGTGVQVSNAGAISNAIAAVIDGGTGDDTIVNRGSLDATVWAVTNATSFGANLSGTSIAKANALSDAVVAGIAGGDGADRMMNSAGAGIAVLAMADTFANNVTIGGHGVTVGEVDTSPTARATGMDGGKGADWIANDGTIVVDARAKSSAANATMTFIGTAAGKAGTTAIAATIGLSGDDGDDTVINRGALTLTSNAESTVSGSSWTLAGNAKDVSALNAAGSSTGLSGGAGADRLHNAGVVTIRSDATLTPSASSSSAIFGKAAAKTQLRADASAVGFDGGDGANVVENVNGVAITARANVSATKAAVTFAGPPTTDALLVAAVESRGVATGADADVISNSGTLAIDAGSTSSITGGAKTTFGGADAAGVGSSRATVSGIDAGGGSNVVTNTRVLDVLGTADVTVINNSKSGWLIGGANSEATGDSDAKVHGIVAAGGDNTVRNADALTVQAKTTAYGFAYASTHHGTINAAGVAIAEATATASAWGIEANDGNNRIVNEGVLSVLSSASTIRTVKSMQNVCRQNEETEETVCTDEEVELTSSPTYAGANGNGASGDGNARATGTATGSAHGIATGQGHNEIVNDGRLDVTAAPIANVTVFADGDLGGTADGTATSRSTATARGVWAGGGNNVISNAGSLTVQAAPTSKAETKVSSGKACITLPFNLGEWCGSGGDGKGTSEATFTADAAGIHVGDGSNRIANTGRIDVLAAPEADGTSAAVTGATKPATVNTNVNSVAIGIRTGNGHNTVVNDSGGVITVQARAVPTALCGGTCTSAVTAVGIQTGDGDDLVINKGEIAASIVDAAGVQRSDLAIRTGGGNDTVVLGEGSRTTGDVRLDNGNDTLVWTGSAVLNSTVDGGGGVVDTFALGGSVNAEFTVAQLDTRFVGFERFNKRDDSTWTLVGDRRMDWTVDQGALAVRGTLTGTVATTNAGVSPTISVLADGRITRDSIGPAVLLLSDARLINAGRIDSTTALGAAVHLAGSDNTAVNDGVIAGVAEAVHDAGTANTLLNHGTITGGAIGVWASGTAGTIVNEGLISGTSAGSNAVVLGGHGITLTNRGVMSAVGSAVRFDAADASSQVINEGGGIIRSDAGLAIEGNDGAQRVVNYGLVSGTGGTAVDLFGGDDEFVIGSTSQMNGVVRGGAGVDSLVLEGSGDATFDMSSIDVTFIGFENFEKAGAATWTLIGAGARDWTVEDGTLAIAGTLSGTVQTAEGGTAPVIAVRTEGTIARTGAAPAVRLNGSASLINDGAIAGDAMGVSVRGGDNRIENRGQIAGASSGTAVVVTGSANQIDNLGTIRSAGRALNLDGSANVVNNRGTVVSGEDALTLRGSDNAVVNTGVIGATGAGVVADGNLNHVSNAGTIASGDSAVRMRGAANLISTNGLVETTGTAAAVDVAGDANRVSNTGTIVSGGVAVLASGNAITIDNRGVIDGGRAAIVLTGEGNIVENTGTLKAGGADSTVQITGSQASLANHGRIQATGTAVTLTGDFGVVTNAGDIVQTGQVGAAVRFEGIGNTIINYGRIAGADGLAIAGSSITVKNHGDVQGERRAMTAEGRGAAIENDGVIRSTAGTGVELAGAGATLTNRWLIAAEQTGVDIRSGAGMTSTFLNESGAVVASVVGPAVRGGAGDDRIENRGVIYGAAGTAVALGAGDDQLLLDTSARLGGTSDGGSGVDTLVLAGQGGLALDLSTTSGFELLRKQDAGGWRLLGAGDMAWAVDAGELAVDAAIAGSGAVREGATLSGTGIVGGVVNQGTVAPGNSIGTLRVNGDFKQTATGTLAIDASIVTGFADRLEVSGQAVINGGTMSVNPEARRFGIATESVVLTARGGVIGGFDSAQTGRSDLDALLSYDPGAVRLTLVRNDVSFRRMADTGNLVALGAALDTTKPLMAHGDFKNVMDGFLDLDQPSQTAALGTLSGELHASLVRGLMDTGDRIFSIATNRQMTARRLADARHVFWTDAFGASGNLSADDNAAGARYRSAGAAIGVEMRAEYGTLLGAALGFSAGTTELEGFDDDRARAESLNPVLYVDHDAGRWAVNGAIGYARHDVETDRGIRVGTIARRAAARYRADQYSAQFGAALELLTARHATLETVGDLRYSVLARPTFVESGAESVGLTDVSFSRTESLRSWFGLRARWTPTVFGVGVTPEMTAGWVHEFRDLSGEMRGTLAGARAAGQLFRVSGVTAARDGAVINIGAAAGIVKSSHAFLGYNNRLTARGSEHGFTAGAWIRW